MRRGTRSPDQSIVYSVMVRRGPDTAHYDLVFGDSALILRYLGEYWERSKPLRGLQRSMDLLVYRMNKHKNRSRRSSVYDISIDYCSIVSFELCRPGRRVRRRRVGKRVVEDVETVKPRLKIKTVDGADFEIVFSPKVYELVKRLVRSRLEPALRKCGNRR